MSSRPQPSPVSFSKQRKVSLPVDLAEKLPCNLDAERSVLGAILLDNTALGAPTEYLLAQDFFIPQHQIIYLKMMEVYMDCQAIDLVTLTERLHAEGKLEQVGGAGYLASLTDGVPRVSNAKHYANIVKEKSRLRQIIHKAHAIQEKAFEGDGKADEILAGAAVSLREVQAPTHDENPLVVVPYNELLTLELPKADPLIDPIVTKCGTFMLYSWSGWGKSWIATELAFRVALGINSIFDGHSGPGGHWPIYGPVRTLYLYGEMHGERIRHRLKLIAKSHDTSPEFAGLGIASKDYQRIGRAPRSAHTWRPSIATAADRKAVEARLFDEGYQFLVLDNVSTLWSEAIKDQSKQVATLKDWYIDLNTKGVTVFFLQHAGKGGDFLGDSAQVHILDSYIQLEHAPDYRNKEGLRVNVIVKKLREFGDPRWGVPFEAKMITDENMGVQWLTRPAMAAQKKSAFELFSNGAPPTEVLKEFHGTVGRSTLYYWHSLWKQNRSASEEDDE